MSKICCNLPHRKQGSYTWIIKNFKGLFEENKGIELWSPTFALTSDNDYKWRLSLYPCGLLKDDKDNISLFLHLVSSVEPELWVMFLVTALRPTSALSYLTREAKISKFEVNKPSSAQGYNQFIGREALYDYMNSYPSLCIQCEIRILKEYDDITIKIPFQISNDFKQLLDSKKYSDFTVKVKDKEFPTHKIVLAARSSVFAAMFDNHMKEDIENLLIIHDFDEEVVEEMINFIYMGKTQRLNEMAYNLLAAANKYNIADLKADCEDALSDELSLENAVDFLLYSELHLATKLKTAACFFIKSHLPEICNTDQFASMLTPRPDILIELIKTVALRGVYQL